MSRLRRLLRWWWAPILILIGLAVLLSVLLSSEAGSAWLLRRVIELGKDQAQEISFDRSRGNLLGRLELSDLRYSNSQQQLEIDRLSLHWHPAALLQGRLYIQALAAHGIAVSLSGSESEPAQSIALPDLRLPLSIQVDQLQLFDVLLGVGQRSHQVDRISLAASLDKDQWSVTDFMLRAEQARLSGDVSMGTQPPHTLTGQFSSDLGARWTHPDLGPLSVTLQLSGPALQPGFSLILHDPAELRVEGMVQLQAPQATLQLQADWPALQWPMQTKAVVNAGPGTLQLQGSTEDYALQLHTSISSEHLPTSSLSLDAQGNLQQLRLHRASLAMPAYGPDQSDQTLELAGTILLRQPHFDLLAKWTELHWPLRQNPQYRLQDGQLGLRGGPEDYQIRLQSRLSGDTLPTAELALDAAGTTRVLEVQKLRLNTLDGALSASGQLGWEPHPRWQLKLKAEQLNPGAHFPDWPGAIDGVLDISGEFTGEDKLQLDARIVQLDGMLRQHPLSAAGRLQLQDNTIHLQDINVSSGPNRAFLQGRINQQLDLRFDIQAPSLDTVHPLLSGSLAGTGSVLGSRREPQLTATLRGQSIHYDELRSEQIDLDVNWLQQGGEASIEILGLQGNSVAYSRVGAALMGSPAAHQLQLSATGDQASADLAANGSWSDSEWQGSIHRLQLAVPELPGRWRLLAPSRLQLSASRVQTETLCLAQAEARLCAAGSWTDTQGVEAQASVRDLELAMLSALLPGEALVDGRLQGELRLQGSLDQPRVHFALRPDDGLIRLEDDSQDLELEYRDAQIHGQFANDMGSAELGFTLENGGQATGRLQMGSSANGPRSLEGRLDAVFPDLSLVGGFVPALDQVDGELSLSSRLTGTLAAPSVSGRLQIARAQARLPATGIDLADIELLIQAEADSPLQIQGQVRSGSGMLGLVGSLDPPFNSGALLDLTVHGENFQAVRLPQAQLQISPRLRIQGSGPYHVSGGIRVPAAEFELQEIPSTAVAVSEDEIVIGEAAGVDETKRSPAITAKVRVDLGDKVHFKGFGLSTDLTGSLEANVSQDGPTTDGKIELRNGRYKAYGQDLQVESGRLLFTGPADKPDIDLQAVRTSLDGRVKAYLALNGPLKKPQTRIYSEPSLPQEEALAYLLTGSGLDRANQQQGLNISAAALSLGLSKSEPWIQDLSQRLGLDVLQLEAGGNDLQDSSLIIGKYLSPDLYLGYSQGLFDFESALLLRLKMSDRLELETRSGEAQSVDLYYRYERD